MIESPFAQVPNDAESIVALVKRGTAEECTPDAIDVARRSLLPDVHQAPVLTVGRLGAVQADLLMVAVSAVILPLAGWLMFQAGLRKAQYDGGLSRWA